MQFTSGKSVYNSAMEDILERLEGCIPQLKEHYREYGSEADIAPFLYGQAWKLEVGKWLDEHGSAQKGKNTGLECRPEQVVAILMRNGVPLSDIRATYKSLTITLENGRYRIYRTASGYSDGSFVMLEPVHTHLCEDQLDADALAGLLLSFDKLLGRVKQRYGKLLDEFAQIRLEKEKEEAAERIARQAVESVLKERVLPLGLSCEFCVGKDGKVRLHLRQALEAEMVFPLSELAVELSDPERVHAAMKPVDPGPDAITDRSGSRPLSARMLYKKRLAKGHLQNIIV